MKVEERFIRQALDLAAQARRRGNPPFGALLVVGDELLLSAENTGITDANPTCHAETNLVQKAIRNLSREQIAEAALYTSAEPCAMCTGAIYWAGIRTVVYALPCEELARLGRGSFAIPCRELFGRASEKVDVAGPFLIEEARKVHENFWK
jgi:tRNA(Arg) A34 adenosine deaminase TadA